MREQIESPKSENSLEYNNLPLWKFTKEGMLGITIDGGFKFHPR